MKILICGDQHFRFELPYATAIGDGRRLEWDLVKKTIYDTAQECGSVVLLGDGLNSRHNHSSVIHEFIDFLKGFGDKEIHILAGNHERYGRNTAIDFIKRMNHKKWFIYTEPTETKVCDISAMMIPFMSPALLGVETKDEAVKVLVKTFPKAKFPLAFLHHAIGGSSINGKKMDFSIDFFNEIIISRKDLENKFDTIFGGHVHEKQRLSPRTIVTGSIFTQEVGEHEKSIWTYEGDKIEEIPLPVRGIYKMIQDRSYWVAPHPASIPKNSIVKCYVTNRQLDIESIKKFLSEFDAYLLVEQYPNERKKIHFESGTLDLSVDNLLELFAKEKNISYQDLKEGFDLIK